jgi:hypothetical protein
MIMHRLLQKSVFDPEEVRQIATAYEATLKALRLRNQQDPVTELVASKIMELAKTGEPDTTRLSELVLKEFDSPKPK